MIEVNGRLYSIHATEEAEVNYLYYSPRTGTPWARLDFSPRLEWIAMRLPPEREQAYMGGYINGSLFTDYDKWILAALPHDLLLREIALMVDLQRPTLSCYNYPTFNEECPAMSPAVMEKINQMRTKVLSGSITDEELREALRMMRADRVTATRNVDARKAAKAPMDADEAINALFG